MQLLVMQLSPPSRHSIPLWSKFSPLNSVAFSSQANHTDLATATGRRILVPTFVDEGCPLMKATVTHGR
jgi:hypothetical protein